MTAIRATIACLAILASGFATPALAGNPAKDAIKEFDKIPRPIRAENPLLPVQYVEGGGRRGSYAVSRRLASLARDGRTFTVKGLVTRKGVSALELESRSAATKSRAWVVLATEDSTRVEDLVPLVLSDLFEFGERSRTSRFVGCTSGTRRLHLASCNHAPPEDDSVPFLSREDAEHRGFQPCAICFSRASAPPIPYFPVIRADATMAARSYELECSAVNDDVLQARTQALGDSLVECLPFEPRGFDYRFRVVHSEFPTARSFATGFVYISDKLYDSVDDRWELAFTLAHEIAHVELHLPRFAPADDERLLGAYVRWWRDTEIEADLVALSCLWKMGAPEDVGRRAARVLRKIEAFVYEGPRASKAMKFDLMPPVGERLAWIAKRRYYFPTATGSGFDKDGELLVRGTLVAAENHEDEFVILVAEESTLGVAEYRQLYEIDVQLPGGKWCKFEVEGESGLRPEGRHLLRARYRVSGWPKWPPDLEHVKDGCLRLVTEPGLKSACTND